MTQKTKTSTTRPGRLPPEEKRWLPAVARFLRTEPRISGVSDKAAIGVHDLAADILEAVVRGDDPRSLFDTGKSIRVRDHAVLQVLERFEAGDSLTDAVKAVAAETNRTEATIYRHLRSFERGTLSRTVWRRSDGATAMPTPEGVTLFLVIPGVIRQLREELGHAD